MDAVESCESMNPGRISNAKEGGVTLTGNYRFDSPSVVFFFPDSPQDCPAEFEVTYFHDSSSIEPWAVQFVAFNDDPRPRYQFDIGERAPVQVEAITAPHTWPVNQT